MQTTVADEIPALEATAGDRKGEPQVLPEAAVLALLVTPLLKRMMHGVK